MEQEPILTLQGADEEYELRRDNTTLYTFLGKAALYDHVFIVTDPEEPTGFYMWNDHPAYPGVADFMFTNDYPMHLNMPEVSECDLQGYDRKIERMCADIGDSVPAEWVDGSIE